MKKLILSLLRLMLLISMISISCSTVKQRNEIKQMDNAKTVNGVEKKPWITRFTIGMLEYFERKQTGEEDKHPTKKVWPPKK